ncbi:MAG: SulP family inorganic anion transporter [Dyella sp.]|uniref:SulP family inorganic anion transporter n=1 Tax=Dyella sp. TaxID=1869338 RepID=UPI003F807DA2
MQLTNLRKEWFSNVRADVLAGTVVALALIPEAIAFSIVAGVDPKVGLYASFCIAVTVAIVGGRPGMISAATGAMALLMVTLVRDHGLQYLMAATLLTGAFQILAGVFKLGALMRFVSKSVVTGFVNALAILIFMAQLPELIGAPWQVYALVVAGLAIIYGVPRFTKVIPSPLICIVVLTIFTVLAGVHVRTVGDMGTLPDSLPTFLFPQVPFNLETLRIVLPYSLPMAVVGLLESMMTAAIVDEFTDTSSNKSRECIGQGTANIVSGLFGGMAGCAMIGQSVINVKSGGRGRLSTLCAGIFLLILVVFARPWVSLIPMGALVAVMIMVSIGTFSWSSVKNLRTHPKSSSVVMVATVAVVVGTHDLAKGVLVGVLLSALFFARKVGRVLHIGSALSADERIREYRVTGQVFFASAESFIAGFDFREALDGVRIDVIRAHFWDLTAVSALDKVVLKFRREGTAVVVHGLNEASATLVDRLGVHDKPNAVEQLMGH